MNIVRKAHNGFTPKRLGFTLVEVVIVMGIMSVMYMLSTQSLFRGIRSATLNEITNQLDRDLRELQIRAMQGQTAQGAIVDYSIRFESDRYILYPGSVYVDGNAQNQIIMLDPSMQFTSIGVPNQTITFGRGSGDIRNFVSGSDFVLLTDTSIQESSRVRLNEHGVVFVLRE